MCPDYVRFARTDTAHHLSTFFLRLYSWRYCQHSNSSSNSNSRGALVSFQVDLVDWWCYRFFLNRFFLSRLNLEVEVDAEVEVSSKLCDWWAGGDGAEFKPGDEVPE